MAEGQNESLDTFIFSYLLNWTWNSWDQMSVLCFHSLIFPFSTSSAPAPVWTISHDVSAIKCILTFATETDSIVKSIDNFDFIFTFCIFQIFKICITQTTKKKIPISRFLSKTQKEYIVKMKIGKKSFWVQQKAGLLLRRESSCRLGSSFILREEPSPFPSSFLRSGDSKKMGTKVGHSRHHPPRLLLPFLKKALLLLRRIFSKMSK